MLQVRDIYDTGLYGPHLIFNMAEAGFDPGHLQEDAGGKTRFQLPCKHQKCTTSMELVPSQSWIANLIEEGHLCRSLVGLPPDEDRVLDPERPSTVIDHGEPSVAPPILFPSHSISPLPGPRVPQSDRPSALPTGL
ncbi:hypothetical protein D1P53_006235 [Cryptococcus gattii VGV]|nr:hypothetical protein D1P53_006235 [Cryptococcus gattii VGV]